MSKMNIHKWDASPEPMPRLKTGDWGKTKKNNMWRCGFDGPVVTTPVFGRVQVRKFEKKNENDSEALVVYFTLMHEDEDRFREKVLDVVEDQTREEVKKGAKDIFGKKGTKDTLFKSSINDKGDYTPSFKSNLVLDYNTGVPVNCEFFSEDGSRMDYETFTEQYPLGTSFSARAYIQFQHMYVQSNNTYGYKSCVRLLQLKEKPRDVPVVNGLKESSGGVDTTPLGLVGFE